MKRPPNLPSAAAKFWTRNAPLCEAMGTLTDADLESFTLLCLTWDRLQRAMADGTADIPFVCLSKQYQSLSKLFGLDPVSRQKLGIEAAKKAEPDEFGL